MSATLLVLRPEPGAAATASAARAMGLGAIVAPLFTVHPLEWALPDNLPDALLLTSAHAARLGGGQLSALHGLPVYAVGKATATAAREAGFAEVTAGEGGAETIIARAARDGRHHLLHLCGREHRAVAHASIAIERRLVYAADAVESLPEAARAALREGAVALLHSPRAAALFATLIDPTDVMIAAISAATLAAAGTRWRATAIADTPTDTSLLAAAAKLCNHKG